DLCYHKNDHEDIGKLGVKGGQSSDATRTARAVPETHNLPNPNASTTIAGSALTPINSSLQAPTILITSHDVNELQ
ncbi:hypothetical protein Tco_1437784, partial [Tanacetum coccineum]